MCLLLCCLLLVICECSFQRSKVVLVLLNDLQNHITLRIIGHLHIHEELREMDWEIFRELCKGIPQEQVELFLALSETMLSNIESL